MIGYSLKMPVNKMEVGFAGSVVANRVRCLREDLGLTYAELSRRLTRDGRDIPPLGLRKIETGTRRVDVDDLLALAVALEVAPVTLLMPPDVDNPDTAVHYRGVNAKRYWDWLTADYPLSGSVLGFYSSALPKWEHDDIETRLGAVRK